MVGRGGVGEGVWGGIGDLAAFWVGGFLYCQIKQLEAPANVRVEFGTAQVLNRTNINLTLRHVEECFELDLIS